MVILKNNTCNCMCLTNRQVRRQNYVHLNRDVSIILVVDLHLTNRKHLSHRWNRLTNSIYDEVMVSCIYEGISNLRKCCKSFLNFSNSVTNSIHKAVNNNKKYNNVLAHSGYFSPSPVAPSGATWMTAFATRPLCLRKSSCLVNSASLWVEVSSYYLNIHTYIHTDT